MAHIKACKPSLSQLSQTSDSESSEHHSPGSFATLPSSGSGDSVIGSADATKVGYISSTSTNKKKNKTPPSEAAGYILVPRDSNNNNNNNNNKEQQGEMVTPPRSKRPRGRPPGSKNKPKPPIVIRQDDDYAMHPILIEITPGSDVMEALIGFARRRHVGIAVLSGSGPVSDVMLRHPLSRVPAFPIHGPFHMLSLSGTYFGGRFAPPLPPPPPSIANPPSSPAWPACSSFSVLLAGTHGQVFGGIVGEKVLAAGIVMVMATLFKRPEFQRLHLVDANGGDEGEGGDGGDDASFAGAVNVANNANASVAGGGGDGDPGSVITNNSNVNNNNNAVNGVGVNYNSLPNMAAAYGVVGSTPHNNCQLVPVTAAGGADVKNVNVMQWNHATHRPDNY